MFMDWKTRLISGKDAKGKNPLANPPTLNCMQRQFYSKRIHFSTNGSETIRQPRTCKKKKNKNESLPRVCTIFIIEHKIGQRPTHAT